MTLNRNGIDNHTIFGRLAEFLHRHDVDIALIQEVTKGDGLTVKGYQSSVNVGTLGRGTAKLHKLHLKIYRLKRIPTGRGSAVYLDNICLVNIYAPSGNANKPERKPYPSNPPGITSHGAGNGRRTAESVRSWMKMGKTRQYSWVKEQKQNSKREGKTSQQARETEVGRD